MEGSTLSENSPCGHSITELKEGLDKLISRLTSFGLTVHVLENRAVVTERNGDKVCSTFSVVDGEEALKFVNQPDHADKVICFNSERFYCHTEYLVLRSTYFQALLGSSYRESTMDVISIHLPAPGNVTPLLRYMYSGTPECELFEHQIIFNTIQNANFLGVEDLLIKTAEKFALKWNVFAFSPLFRRSIVDSRFLSSVLEQGTKNRVFNDGDKLRIVVLWNEEEECTFSESKRLIFEHKCLEDAGIGDLEWALETKPKLFGCLEQSAFRVVYQRSLRDSRNTQETIRLHQDKIKNLSQCIRTLSRQLEEVRCNRCQLLLPRAAMKSRTCIVARHLGQYVINKGWDCCGELLKRSKGCKPVSLSRHCMSLSARSR